MWSGGKQGEQVHVGAVSTFFTQEKKTESKPEAKQEKYHIQETKQKTLHI